MLTVRDLVDFAAQSGAEGRLILEQLGLEPFEPTDGGLRQRPVLISRRRVAPRSDKDDRVH